jgi:hypothetical protein
MSKENDILILRGRLAVTQALWDYEREQILEALGLELNPRSWSTGTLVEEIKDSIQYPSSLFIEELPDVSLEEGVGRRFY